MSLTTYPSNENTANKITAFYPSCERTPCAARLVSSIDQHTVAMSVSAFSSSSRLSLPVNQWNTETEKKRRDSEFSSASCFFQRLDVVGIGKANRQCTKIGAHFCGVHGF
jgi:hypothetical protein